MTKLPFITKVLTNRAKPKSAVPTMKKITKVMEAMGKEVGGYEISPEGAVRVFVAKEGKAAKPNEWDVVLK
jgi:hypothetical protein